MDVSEGAILSRRDGVVFRKASEELVLLDVESGQYYSVNEVGARAWDLCDGSRSVAEIIEIMCREYDAPEGTIRTDVTLLLQDLVSEDVLVKTTA